MLVDERFTIRAFRAGDEPQILDLFARCFPHAPRSLEHFRWKYQSNPFGNERISLAFDPDGRLVGHYAGYPVRLCGTGSPTRRADGLESPSHIAHHIGDTMTDPAVRHVGRGPSSILGRVAQHFYDTFCEGRVAFNFGFNVANIQKFSTRFLRAVRVEPVSYRVWAHPARMARWQRWARGYQIEIVREVTDELGNLSHGFMVRRDAQYLRWRYLQHPEVSYLFLALRRWRKLAGWSVFRIREDHLIWVDGLFDSPGSAGILLRQAADGRPIECWNGGDELRALGFESRPEPQDLGVMCVPFAMTDAVERIRQSFFYTMGDSDLF
ncbi:MAG: GNAT family N-acetyltransferase [Acidobacteriota bacterium]